MIAGRGLAERDVRLAEQVVELDVEARDPDAGPDAEGVREDARAAVRVDRDHVRRVLAAVVGRLERPDERERAVRLRQPGQRREPGEQLGDTGEAAARGHAPPAVLDEHGIRPDRAVLAQLGCGQHDPVDPEQLLGERAAVDAHGALVRERLQALREPRLHEELAGLQYAPVPCEECLAAFQRENGREHVERAVVHLRERDAVASKTDRRLYQMLPGQAPEPFPELPERGREARDRARGRADLVHDHLVAERHRHLEHVGALGRHRGEAVQVRHPGSVEGDRVATREEPAHDRLGDARREAHRNDGVRRGAAVREDLRPDLGSRRMTSCNARSHGQIVGREGHPAGTIPRDRGRGSGVQLPSRGAGTAESFYERSCMTSQRK